jgi:hypothetical protein
VYSDRACGEPGRSSYTWIWRSSAARAFGGGCLVVVLSPASGGSSLPSASRKEKTALRIAACSWKYVTTSSFLMRTVAPCGVRHARASVCFADTLTISYQFSRK